MTIQSILLAGLLKIELPAQTVLLCDGGTLEFDGDTYLPRDPTFGVVSRCDALTEGVGDNAPAFSISFLPDPDADAADLISPDYQGSRLRAWIAEVDAETGLVSGDPRLEVDAIIDVPQLHFPASGRVLDLNCVSVWQLLLDRSGGNLLNGGFHKRIYPSELGLDNATGVSQTVAWGTKSIRGTVAAIVGSVVGGGTGGGGGSNGGGGGGSGGGGGGGGGYASFSAE